MQLLPSFEKDVFFSIFCQIANRLLSDEFGQEALKALYRFTSYNSEWIQTAVGVTATLGGGSEKEEDSEDPFSNGPTKPKLLPWDDSTFKLPNALEMTTQIGELLTRPTLSRL